MSTQTKLLELHRQNSRLSDALFDLYDNPDHGITDPQLRDLLYDLEELTVTLSNGLSRALILSQLVENPHAPDTA